jgi:hypothetical protein
MWTSLTLPSGSLSHDTTLYRSKSLIRTTIVSWYVVGDVLSRPALEVVGREIVGFDGEIDRRTDVHDELHGDPTAIGVRVTQPLAGAVHPLAQTPPTHPICERPRTGKDGRDVEVAVVGPLQFEVVDVATENAMAIA